MRLFPAEAFSCLPSLTLSRDLIKSSLAVLGFWGVPTCLRKYFLKGLLYAPPYYWVFSLVHLCFFYLTSFQRSFCLAHLLISLLGHAEMSSLSLLCYSSIDFHPDSMRFVGPGYFELHQQSISSNLEAKIICCCYLDFSVQDPMKVLYL